MISDFPKKYHRKELFAYVHQHYLLYLICLVVFSDLHQFSILGKDFPLGHRRNLHFSGSFQERGMQPQQLWI